MRIRKIVRIRDRVKVKVWKNINFMERDMVRNMVRVK